MEESQILFDQLSVLLIEDSDNDALIIAKMLEREAHRFKIVRAQTREEMEQALTSHVFDVILCDHDMPEFSSRGALEVRDRRSHDIPFIIVTGAIGGEEVAIELMRRGVADFIPKHKMTRLLPALKREIREARLRQAKRDADEALRLKNAELEATVETLVRNQDELVRAGRLKGLGRMAAGISHELNNALSRITGLVEQIEEGGGVGSVENFKLIRKAVEEAVTTVRSLSYFSDVHPRGEKGHPVSINETIAESLDIFTSQMEAVRRPHDPRILITTGLRDVPPVTGDADHFRDAITSLILRAHESMPDGGELRIHSYRDTRAVVVEVEDTGTGMPEELLRNCLEPYFATDHELSGLRGLAWVNALVERYGGVMRIESHEGFGTKVTLRFTIHDSDVAASQSGAQDRSDFRPLKIIVVDDEKLITESLASCLEEDSHFVKAASNGFDALELLRNEHFDLVISDRAMREFNGEELARKVRERGDGVRFILATGTGDQLIANCSVLEGVDAILPKPITRDSLRCAIKATGVYLPS